MNDSSNKSRTIDLNKGMFPPSSVELEEAVLGACLIDNKCLFDVVSVLKTSDCFYKDNHKFIYEVILDLFKHNQPVDLLTVSARLRSMELYERAGGDYYLITLTQKISSGAHAEYHSRLLLQFYLKRMIILFNSRITAMAYDESVDVFDLISNWSKEFDKVSEITSAGRSTMSFQQSLSELKKSVEFISSRKEEFYLTGVDTGFNTINKYTSGYQPQDLIIVAARPGMGKTAKVLKTAVENVKNNIPVGVISGEMSMKQLTARCVAIDTDFHLNQLLKYGFEKSQYFISLNDHIARMESYPLYVDDSGNMDISDVIITAKQWYRKQEIKLLIIDYIQLMKDRSRKWSNRNEELLDISRRLKLLAKELEIPVIVLAQVSRDCEKRGGSKRPMLIDIKDCGGIEQDADIVEFIYRPEYYNIEMNEEDYDDNLKSLVRAGGNTEIIFAKYRAGAIATAILKWIGDKTKFADVDDAIGLVDDDFIYTSIPNGDIKDAF